MDRVGRENDSPGTHRYFGHHVTGSVSAQPRHLDARKQDLRTVYEPQPALLHQLLKGHDGIGIDRAGRSPPVAVRTSTEFEFLSRDAERGLRKQEQIAA